jgi:hypothetical protein
MNNGIEAFRSQLQIRRNSGLSISPKDPLLALWVAQKELLEQNAAQQQKLLSEFQAALGKSQTAWSEQAKALAQRSLNAGLQAAQNSTALLLEEAARVNRAAVRQAFEEGCCTDGASVDGRPADRLAESGGRGCSFNSGLRHLHARDSLTRIGLKQTASGASKKGLQK